MVVGVVVGGGGGGVVVVGGGVVVVGGGGVVVVGGGVVVVGVVVVAVVVVVLVVVVVVLVVVVVGVDVTLDVEGEDGAEAVVLGAPGGGVEVVRLSTRDPPSGIAPPPVATELPPGRRDNGPLDALPDGAGAAAAAPEVAGAGLAEAGA